MVYLSPWGEMLHIRSRKHLCFVFAEPAKTVFTLRAFVRFPE